MILEFDNISMYYETRGKGIPVLMFHGFASDHRLMIGACEPSLNRNETFERIYFDLPGMGSSPPQDWIQSADDLLSCILKFIDNMLSNKKYLICAHSYGAYLARGIIKARSEDVLGAFFFCPVIQPIHKLRNRPPLKILIEDENLLSTLTPYERKKYTSITVIQSPETWERYRTEFLPGIKGCDRELYHRVMNQYAMKDNPDVISVSYSFPTVFITGRQDSVVGYKDAYDILDNYTLASFVILDGAGHNLHAELPKEFDYYLQYWIERIEKSLLKSKK